MFRKKIKQIAIRIAVLFFFVMAFVGWMSDLEIVTCSMRAVIGAFGVYFIVSVAGQLIARVLINAMIDDQINQHSHLAKGNK